MSHSDMQIHYEDAEHRYWLEKDGSKIEVPSITQCLRPIENLSGIDPETLARAAQRGTDVHRACELVEGGGDGTGLCRDSLDPEIAGYVSGYEKFLKETGWKSTRIEWMVGSWKYKFAGRIDRFGTMDRVRQAVLEIKTSQPSPRDAVQTAGQVLAAVDDDTECVLTTVRRFAVYLSPKGTYKLQEHKGLEDRATFFSCLSITHFRRTHYGHN